MKRGDHETYHRVSQQHMKKYLAEFDFRYNERSALGIENAERMTKSIKGIVGRRMTYRHSLPKTLTKETLKWLISG